MATRYEAIFIDDIVNDVPTHIVGCAGGEPEDQLLVRDWDWVAIELTEQAAKRDASSRTSSNDHPHR